MLTMHVSGTSKAPRLTGFCEGQSQWEKITRGERVMRRILTWLHNLLNGMRETMIGVLDHEKRLATIEQWIAEYEKRNTPGK